MIKPRRSGFLPSFPATAEACCRGLSPGVTPLELHLRPDALPVRPRPAATPPAETRRNARRFCSRMINPLRSDPAMQQTYHVSKRVSTRTLTESGPKAPTFLDLLHSLLDQTRESHAEALGSSRP